MNWHRLTAATATSGDKDQDDNDMAFNFDRLSKCLKYAQDCISSCGDFCPPLTTSEPSNAEKSITAVVQMLRRMEKVCVSYALQGLASGKFQGKDYNYKAVLPEMFHPIAHVMETNWADEKDKLAHAKLETLIEKLSTCESALSFGTSSSKIDLGSTFETKIQECHDFASHFAKALQGSLNEEQSTYLTPLSSFTEKYQMVSSCVSDWTLKEIEWVFCKENEKEVGSDFDTLKESRKQALDFVTCLKPMMEFQSQSEVLKPIVAASHKAKDAVEEAVDAASRLGTVMMFADAVVDGAEAAKPGFVDKTEKYTQKHFGMGKDILPDKLKEMVNAAVLEASKKEKEKGNVKAAKDKKEKSEKSEKGKSKSSHKDGKEKRKSSRAEDNSSRKKAKK